MAPKVRKVIGDCFVLLDQLGKGSFAEVFSVQFVDAAQDDEPMAAKVFKINGNKPSTTTSTLDNEITCWKRVQGHPNIVDLKCVFSTETHTYIIQERVDGHELFQFVVDTWEANGCGDVGLSVPQAVHYFKQLASAVLHMHQRGVAHRDIKPENILIDVRSDTIKLIDFGLSTTERMSPSTAGTLDYIAPEVLICKGRVPIDTYAADVWSCGVVLFVMLTARLPFSGQSDSQTSRAITYGKFYTPPSVVPLARDLLCGLLHRDPLKRITLDDALQHPFITSFLTP